MQKLSTSSILLHTSETNRTSIFDTLLYEDASFQKILGMPKTEYDVSDHVIDKILHFAQAYVK